MTTPGSLTIAARGAFDIVMTRALDAPRTMVFDAFTKPELVKRWLLGPDGWTMPICEIDLRLGGSYKYVWRRESNGKEMVMFGTYKEIKAPERVVSTEKFQDPWYPGEAITTLQLVEQAGRTTVTQTMHLPNREARDGILKSGMETGVEASYKRLEPILASLLSNASGEKQKGATGS
jgi:uncharacterized protein YndB with AHSA1/START domain